MVEALPGAKSAPSSVRIGLALAAVYVIWGSTYIGIRFAIDTLPPFSMAGVRYLIAGGLLYGWARWRGAPRPSFVHWRSSLVIGALLLLGGNGGVVWAEQRVATGLAALVVATEPFWIVMLDWARPSGVRPVGRVFAGLALGMAGMVILVRPAEGAGSSVDLVGAAVLALASLSWAIGSLYSRGARLPETPLLATGMQMLSGGALLLLLGIVTGEPARFDPSKVSGSSLLALVYLIIFGSLIGFSAYSWLLRVVPPTLASTYAYVNPVVAVFLGWALLSEPLTGTTLAAAAVIVTGVALITTAPSRQSGEEPRLEGSEEEPEPCSAC